MKKSRLEQYEEIENQKGQVSAPTAAALVVIGILVFILFLFVVTGGTNL